MASGARLRYPGRVTLGPLLVSLGALLAIAPNDADARAAELAIAPVSGPEDAGEGPTAAGPIATPPPATGHGDAIPRSAGQPTTLYINFDGAVLRSGCGNDAHRDCSTLDALFDGYVGPFPGSLNQKLAIIQAARKDLADFGVRVVTERPPDESEYTMILYGDLGPQSFAGIAPYIDCGDLWPSDTGFANAYSTSNTGSTIILQEAAHTWGLEHVNAPLDNMHPFKTPSVQSFTDACQPIVASTDLDATGGVCNQVHTLFCEVGHQNSWQELRYLFGPPVPDTSAPTVEITSPEDGSVHVLPVTLPLRGEIHDDLGLQVFTISVLQDGAELFSSELGALDLSLTNPPAGDYDLTVRVSDEAGNVGEASVRFTVLPEGSPLPEPEPEEGADGGCRVGPRPALAWLLLPLLAPLRPRRRRR